jgi:ribonuclease BN (tRNA processing enzyme)
VRLTVLGSDGTWPGAGGECSGFLLSAEGFHLWLEAGTGTFARLQEHVSVGEVGAILISHGHADHFLDVIPAFYARHYGGLGAPGLPFVSPPGFAAHMASLVSERGRDVMREAFSFTETGHGEVFDVGPFRVSAFEMTHVGVPSLGYRIEHEGNVLAYTGDTGPCENAVELGGDADLFLCEATYQNASDLAYFHMSAQQAAQHATRAGAKRLMLTHILPTLDPRVSLEEAVAHYEGPIDGAVRGGVWEVGA